MMGQLSHQHCTKLYEIYFFKTRDLVTSDIPLIEEISKYLHIPFDNLKFTNKNGKLYITIEWNIIKSNIINGNSLSMLCDMLKNLEYSLAIENTYNILKNPSNEIDDKKLSFLPNKKIKL